MTEPRIELVNRLEQAASSAEADVTAQLRAAPHERTPERSGYRNGYRVRPFDSRMGALEIAIPKTRTGSYFLDWLAEPRRRAPSGTWSR